MNSTHIKNSGVIRTFVLHVTMVLLVSIMQMPLRAQQLRATWIARDAMSTKETLAQAIDSLARANFNVVYINAWSRGYPLWQSDYFFSETGLKTDPVYSSRDIIAEAVAECHKHGIHVEAWFEYGFVGGWSGNMTGGSKGPIFKKHPDWVAKTQTGVEIDNSNFYWMIHTHPGVQQFLIGLATELCRKYDIDGIELDRIRYSSLAYGYDSYTDSLYRQEHNGAAPQKNISDPQWIRWRADKLNQFMKAAYDSINAVNPNVNVSNAPSLYGTTYTSYNSYAQDWFSWVNDGYIDNVQVQSYVSLPSSFGNILDYIKSSVKDRSKIFPSIAIAPGGTYLEKDTISRLLSISDNRGFEGNSIWYYTDMRSKGLFSWFRNNIYREKAFPPFSTADWREYYDITSVNSTDAEKYGTWTSSSLQGFSGPTYSAAGGDSASVGYYFDVPADGYYEVYAYIVAVAGRSAKTNYQVTDSNGKTYQIYVDQSNPWNRRWYKLGDFFFAKGRRMPLKVSNSGLKSTESAGADAAMILLNRRLSPAVVSVEGNQQGSVPENMNFDLKNYPNPFNGETNFVFELKETKPYDLEIFNVLGQRVYAVKKKSGILGKNIISFNSHDLPSGIYLCSLVQDSRMETIKIVLTK